MLHGLCKGLDLGHVVATLLPIAKGMELSVEASLRLLHVTVNKAGLHLGAQKLKTQRTIAFLLQHGLVEVDAFLVGERVPSGWHAIK